MMLQALQYLRQGYSVIPLCRSVTETTCDTPWGVHLRPHKVGKTPKIKWEEYQERFPTEGEVREWFTKWPTANLGIVTGRLSGIGVVDVDGPEGITEAQRLGFHSPLMALTGKGRQLIYKHPGGTLCNGVRIYPGIDVRGDGGYIAAPPSIHPNGRRYQWVGASAIGQKNQLPTFPLSVFAATSAPAATKSTGWIAKALEEMTNGNIDNTLFKVCARLRADGYSEADALILLTPHADRVGAAPGHLRDKISNVWKRYEPNSRPESAQEAPVAESFESFMAELTPIDWICKPLIAKGAFAFVAGLAETNKTWLLMDLALECARAQTGNWLSLFPVAHSRVLFIDQERFKGETQRRFRAMAADKGILPKDTNGTLFVRCGTSTRLDLTPSYEAFRRELAEIRPDLVIIDSWASFQSCEENNKQSVQVVLERVKALRTEFNCAFIFIDHENKYAFQQHDEGKIPNVGTMSGSTAKPAAGEMVLTVRRFDDETVVVHHTKSTGAQKIKSFFAKVVNTEMGVRVYGRGDK